MHRCGLLRRAGSRGWGCSFCASYTTWKSARAESGRTRTLRGAVRQHTYRNLRRSPLSSLSRKGTQQKPSPLVRPLTEALSASTNGGTVETLAGWRRSLFGGWNLLLFFHRLRGSGGYRRLVRKFLLAFKVHTCHNLGTVCGRHAVSLKFQEGHSFGCLVFGKHNPNSAMNRAATALAIERRRLATFMSQVHLTLSDPAA